MVSARAVQLSIINNGSVAGVTGARRRRTCPTLVSSRNRRDAGEMRRVVATVLALVCLGVGLAGCESSGEASGDRLAREYAECMADDNSALHRRMVSGETGTVPLSVAGAEARVREQMERGELTMAEMEASYVSLFRVFAQPYSRSLTGPGSAMIGKYQVGVVRSITPFAQQGAVWR